MKRTVTKLALAFPGIKPEVYQEYLAAFRKKEKPAPRVKKTDSNFESAADQILPNWSKYR